MEGNLHELLDELFDAMLARRKVYIKTETRKFSGHVREIGISPFSAETRASVVDEEGRVHYFFVERAQGAFEDELEERVGR